MSSKFDNLFFERYIHGECSDSERAEFESVLADQPDLKTKFENAKSYFDLIKSAPQITPAVDFTDRVIREIRVRAEERQFSFSKLTKGLFSREILGVITAVVVLAFLFRTQMMSAVDSFAPQKITESSLLSYDTDGSISAERAVESSSEIPQEKHAEQKTSANPAVMDQVKSKGSAEPMCKSVPAQTAQTAPALSEDRPENETYAAAAVLYESDNALPVIESEKKDAGVPAPASQLRSAAKAETHQEKMVSTYSDMEDSPLAKTKEASPFPFAQFKAAVVFGDTITVTLPKKQLKPFTKAWKEYGGTIIDTVVSDSAVIMRVSAPR